MARCFFLKPVLSRALLGLLGTALFIHGCGERFGEAGQGAAAPTPPQGVLRLAVTTSTRDTGLIDELVREFEKPNSVRIDVVAVGTGKALKLGENGDVDIVLVHARAAEDRFMVAGHGARREDVMYNRFEVLGPAAVPARIKGMAAVEALQRIAGGKHRFVSRGDQSGTHQRERSLWQKGGGRAAWDGYVRSGQGMGATLVMADQMQAYTLSDRGTYLAFKARIELVPLVTYTEDMRNPYGIMTVNPNKNEQVRYQLADRFVDFMISTQAQKMIRDFHIEGEQLFHPLHLRIGNDPWN